MPAGYVKNAYYRLEDKSAALKNAARLRKTRRYNAKVLLGKYANGNPNWTLWVKLAGKATKEAKLQLRTIACRSRLV